MSVQGVTALVVGVTGLVTAHLCPACSALSFGGFVRQVTDKFREVREAERAAWADAR